MSDTFLASSKVKVFPSTYRTTDDSMYTSEKNLTGIIKAITDYDSYVISSNGNAIKFVLRGYYFDIDLTDNESAVASSNDVWATIYLSDNSELISSDGTTAVDSGNLFKGLKLTDTNPGSGDYLKIKGDGVSTKRMNIANINTAGLTVNEANHVSNALTFADHSTYNGSSPVTVNAAMVGALSPNDNYAGSSSPNGKATTAATADKVANLLTFSDGTGGSTDFNGSAAVEITKTSIGLGYVDNLSADDIVSNTRVMAAIGESYVTNATNATNATKLVSGGSNMNAGQGYNNRFEQACYFSNGVPQPSFRVIVDQANASGTAPNNFTGTPSPGDIWIKIL